MSTIQHPPRTPQQQQAGLFAHATAFRNSGFRIAMVKIGFIDGHKKLLANPAHNWHEKQPPTDEQIELFIRNGYNAYFYRLPDGVTLIDTDTPEATEWAESQNLGAPVTFTRKGRHYLVMGETAGAPAGVDTKPRQAFGPGSFYRLPDGTYFTYVGQVPDINNLPAAPRNGHVVEMPVNGHAVIGVDSFFAGSTKDQKFTELMNAPEGKCRNTLNAAAFYLGGLVEAGRMSEKEAIDGMIAACTDKWGRPDDNDIRTIQAGLRDGHNKPLRISPSQQPTSEAAPGAVFFRAVTDDEYHNPTPPNPPVYGAFGGNQPLFYAQGVHWLQGEPESGKSWLAMAVAAEHLRNGERILYLDYEDSRHTVVGRMKQLGMTAGEATRFVYQDGRDVPFKVLQEHVENVTYSLLVIDGVIEGLNNFDFSDNSDGGNNKVNAWNSALLRKATSTICIDHVVKARDDRQGKPIGAQAKKGVVRAAMYEVICIEPFGLNRHTGQATNGAIRLVLHKDSTGALRGAGVRQADVRVLVDAETQAVTITAGSGGSGLFSRLYAAGVRADASQNDVQRAARELGLGYGNRAKADVHANYLAWLDQREEGMSDLFSAYNAKTSGPSLGTGQQSP